MESYEKFVISAIFLLDNVCYIFKDQLISDILTPHLIRLTKEFTI